MLTLYHLYHFRILFLQLRITVWSLCTKAVSYIKYPKACQKGEYDSDIDFSVFSRLLRGRVRSTRGQARRRPGNHMPFSNLWRGPSYVTKLWLR